MRNSPAFKTYLNIHNKKITKKNIFKASKTKNTNLKIFFRIKKMHKL